MAKVKGVNACLRALVSVILLSTICNLQLGTCDLVINELAVNTSTDFAFIELKYVNDSVDRTNYPGHYLLAVYYDPTNTSQYVTDFPGNFRIGDLVVISSNQSLQTNQKGVISVVKTDLPPTGTSFTAVALFKHKSTTPPTNESVGFTIENAILLDSVVFSRKWIANFSQSILNDLTIKSSPLLILSDNSSLSLSRCGNPSDGSQSSVQTRFVNSTQTPLSENLCPEAPGQDEVDPPEAGTSTTNVSTTTTVNTTPTVPGPATTSPTSATTANVSSTVTSPSPSPTPSRQVVINEVSLIPGSQFVELKFLGDNRNFSGTTLDNLTLVFWNTPSQNYSSYFIQDLSGHVLEADGYFVVGNNNSMNPKLFVNTTDFFKLSAYDAIVLYENINTTALPSTIMRDQVVDAVVLRTRSTPNPPLNLLHALFPQQQTGIHTASPSGHVIVVRCYSEEPMNLGAFSAVNTTTAGVDNVCTTPSGLQINEFKLSPNGTARFIEIGSKERPGFPLEQIVLATFDAITNESVAVLRLTGKTNSNTTALVSEDPTLPSRDVNDTAANSLLGALDLESPVVISLYWRPEDVADITDPMDRVISEARYGGNHSVVKYPVTDVMKSVSYCSSSTSHLYAVTDPTPNAENSCPTPTTSTTTSSGTSTPSASTPSSSTPSASIPSSITPSAGPSSTTPKPPPGTKLVLSEVYVGETAASDFVELRVGVKASLDLAMLVFLVEDTAITISSSVSLQGKTVPASGILTLSSPDITLPRSPDKDCAVVVYSIPSADYKVTTFARLKNDSHQLDFVVYRAEKPSGSSPLTQALTGDGDQVALWLKDGNQTSATRCLPQEQTMWAFWLQTPSKGTAAECKAPMVLINEINAANPSYENKEFMELFDSGIGHVSLNPFVLVALNGLKDSDQVAVVDLWNEQTDEHGFFLLAVEGDSYADHSDKNVPKKMKFFRNGPGAIALYQAPPSKFASQSQPVRDGLKDVVIYGNNSTGHVDVLTGLIAALTPGGSFVNTMHNTSVDKAMTRCLCWGMENNAKAFALSDPTPREQNACPTNFNIELTPFPKLFINEINSVVGKQSVGEFIEIKGPANSSLAGVALVFYDTTGAQPLHVFLDEYSLDRNGFIVIGAKSDKVDVALSMDKDKEMLVSSGLGGVALYDSRQWGCGLLGSLNMKRPGLVDALVYTPTQKAPNMTQLKTFLEALKLDSHYLEDARAYKGEQSISRCSDELRLNSTQFAMSRPTPGEANKCPSSDYKFRMSFKLIDADCKEFKDEMMDMVLQLIVDRVNAKCQCGFTIANVRRPLVVCGSVIVQATIYATSSEQKELLQLEYKKFVKNTTTVVVGTKKYTVDPTCFMDCTAVGPHPSTNKHDKTVTIAVAVSCVVVFSAIVVAVFIYLRRKRKGIAHFRMARFDAEDENLTIGDMDDFVGNDGEQASFRNPLYFRT